MCQQFCWSDAQFKLLLFILQYVELDINKRGSHGQEQVGVQREILGAWCPLSVRQNQKKSCWLCVQIRLHLDSTFFFSSLVLQLVYCSAHQTALLLSLLTLALYIPSHFSSCPVSNALHLTSLPFSLFFKWGLWCRITCTNQYQKGTYPKCVSILETKLGT